MKILKPLVVLFLLTLPLLSLAEHPAEKKPEAKKPAAEKTEAEKMADEKKAAEAARYNELEPEYWGGLRGLDAVDAGVVDSWVALRDALTVIKSANGIWGFRARKDAERQKEKLTKRLPRLLQDFNKNYDRQLKKLIREERLKQSEATRLASRNPSGNERMKAVYDKELSVAQAEFDHIDAMIKATKAMKSHLTYALKRHKKRRGPDRMSFAGIKSDYRAIRNEPEKYKRMILALYDVKDRKADVEELEARKKANKDWTRSDDANLQMAQRYLEQTGKKLETVVEIEQGRIKREIDKLKSKIAQLEKRIKGLRKGDMQDRYSREKWDLETELHDQETTVAQFKTLAAWKPPAPPEANPADKPAAKK